MPPINSKVVVIGNGRFGNATAQGLRAGFVVSEDGDRAKCDVVQVSARKFFSQSVTDMAAELHNTAFVTYCGTNLPMYAGNMALAIQQAAKQSSGPALEFIDFSNPDPTLEKGDVSGAIDLWMALKAQGSIKEVTPSKIGDTMIKVWKVTEVGSVDVSGIVGNTDGLVYGSHPGGVPKIFIPNLNLRSAGPNADLFEEARTRINERSGVDRWHDGNLMGMAVFVFTSIYAIFRYDISLNGSEPHSSIPMYLLDKGFAWTALWMMVVSPFAGNILALKSIYEKWANVDSFQKIITVFCTLVMILPSIQFSICYIFWIFARGMYFGSRWPINTLYLSQDPHQVYGSQTSWLKASLVDMVNLKGETGCVGFVYAIVHSFLGVIVCDVAYKGLKWFSEETGRLHWHTELCMTTGAVSTALLGVVAMRSLFGKASWIVLKPLYSYVSPIGIWFAVIHVMSFGIKGWNTLFDPSVHNGQLSITFMSSMFPACVLFIHHIMAIFGTKKFGASDHLWQHSAVSIASAHYHQIEKKANLIDATYHIELDSWHGDEA